MRDLSFRRPMACVGHDALPAGAGAWLWSRGFRPGHGAVPDQRQVGAGKERAGRFRGRQSAPSAQGA